MRAKVTLKVVAGPFAGKTFRFKKHDTLILGRAPDCHVRLVDDPYVSRHHFFIEASPPEVRIRDLGSMNGTYVNGQKCGGRLFQESVEEGKRRTFPEVDLADGDQIQVGKTVLNVQVKHSSTELSAVRCCHCGIALDSVQSPDAENIFACAECRRSTELDPEDLFKSVVRAGITLHPTGDGLTLEGYKVIEKLGEGGMGAVHLVEAKDSGDRLAVKIMHSRVAVSDLNRQTFLRELEILRELDHPNIVRFHASGTHGNAFLLFMEYCDRGSIKSLLKRHKGKLPWPVVAPLLKEVLLGLDYAHRRGVVHRDIKPHNILLVSQGEGYQVKIADFGLAKNFEQAGLGGLTATGDHAGTYPYMAKEQLTDFKRARPAADIWSVGATFYRLMAGRHPRKESKSKDPIDVVLEDEIVPILDRGIVLPEAVARMIDTALASDPKKRYPDASAFLDALAEVPEIEDDLTLGETA